MPTLDFLRASASAMDGDCADRIAKQVKTKGKPAMVFATHKFIVQKELSKMGIIFCGLPFAVEGVA